MTRPKFAPGLSLALFVTLFVGSWLSSLDAQAPAGTEGQGVRAPQGAASRPKITTRKPAAAAPAHPAPAAKGDAALDKSKSAAGGTPAQPAEAPGAPEGKGLLGRLGEMVGPLVELMGKYAVWLIIGLGAILAALLYFLLKGEDRSDLPPELAPRRASREHAPQRAAAVPAHGKAAPPVADREYALVVDEADLKMPPLPEDAAAKRRRVDPAAIQALLEKRNFEAAYQEYQKEIEADGGSEFAPDVERRLGEHFLKGGDLKKAARILEHHVATHAGDQIQPETYFDLGYIHFKAKTIAKSRRYLRLFVERHADPILVERARRILARLEKVHNLN